MNITASMVKDLRTQTGAGMMDCKKALVEAEGDIAKAVDILREKGLSQAAKKASRVAAEGAVGSAVSEDGKTGTILEVNCETDFVGSWQLTQLMLKHFWILKSTERKYAILLLKQLQRLVKTFPFAVSFVMKVLKARYTAISMAAARSAFSLR